MINDSVNGTICSNDFPYTDEFYKESSDDVWFWVLFAFCALICCVLIIGFLEHLWYFHTQVAKDEKLYKQVYLLGIYPVVASLSFIAIAVPRSTILTDLLASVYLSAAIYQFVSLTIIHYGGAKSMLATMEQETVSFRTPPVCCCLCCLNAIPFNKRTLNVLRTMVLQIVIIRPILMLILAILWTNGQYNPGEMSPDSPTLYITILNTMSTLLAMQGLIVTFRSSKVRLKEERLAIKFAALQLAIIIVNLQNIIFSVLSNYDIPKCIGTRGSKVRGSSAHHMLLVLEMLLLGVLARFGYRRTLLIMRLKRDSKPKDNQEPKTETSNVIDTTEVMHYDSFHPYAYTNTSVLTDSEFSVKL